MTARAACAALVAALLTPQLAAAQADLTGEIAATVDGHEARLIFTITNVGDVPTGYITAAVFYDLDHAPGAQDFADDVLDFPDGLAPGASAMAIRDLDDLEAGMHAAWMHIDSPGLVDDADRANNVVGPASYTTTARPVPRPDLAVTAAEVSQGDLMTFAITVANQGDAPTRVDAFLDLYLSRTTPPAGGDEPNRFATIPPLAPGETCQHDITTGFPDPGDHQAWIVLDPYGTLSESDEENNLFGPLAYRVAPRGGPPSDLVIDDVVVSSPSPRRVKVEATVRNDGEGHAPEFTWAVYLDPVGAITVDTLVTAELPSPVLAPGASRVVSVEFDARLGGHDVYVKVDAREAVVESDEGNNQLGPFPARSTSGVNLRILDFRAVILPERRVRYAVDVENDGLEDAGPFDIDVIFDHPVAPTLLSDPFPEGTFANETVGLPAGAQASYVLERLFAPLGAEQAWALLDLGDAIFEPDEEDNVAGPLAVDVVEVVHIAQLEIERLAVKAEDGRLRFEFTLANTGTAAAGPFRVELYYHWDESSQPQYGDPGDDQVEVEGLEAGASLDFVHVSTPLATGAYRSWILVDAGNDVDEFDEFDNFGGPTAVPLAGQGGECAVGAAIKGLCQCDGTPRFDGFCCATGWQEDPCGLDAGPDAGGYPDISLGFASDLGLGAGTSESSSGCSAGAF